MHVPAWLPDTAATRADISAQYTTLSRLDQVRPSLLKNALAEVIMFRFRPLQPWVHICTQLSLSQPSLSYQLSFVSLSALSQLSLSSLSSLSLSIKTQRILHQSVGA